MKLKDIPEGMLIKAYIQLRDKKREIEAEHKKRLEPIQQSMLSIEDELHRRMLEAGLTSMSPADGGTAYISRTTTAPIRDKSAFLDFVINRGAWELLDLKANGPAVSAFIEETGETPAGIELKIREKVNIRK